MDDLIFFYFWNLQRVFVASSTKINKWHRSKPLAMNKCFEIETDLFEHILMETAKVEMIETSINFIEHNRNIN